VAESSEFEVDVDLAESLFVWNGPTQTMDEANADRHADHERDMATRRDWLAERGLTGIPLPATPQLMLHEWDDDGSIYASVDLSSHATVLRRPISDGHWDAADTVNYPHSYRWADARWEWLIGINQRPLDEIELHTLKDYLAHTT